VTVGVEDRDIVYSLKIIYTRQRKSFDFFRPW